MKQLFAHKLALHGTILSFFTRTVDEMDKIQVGSQNTTNTQTHKHTRGLANQVAMNNFLFSSVFLLTQQQLCCLPGESWRQRHAQRTKHTPLWIAMETTLGARIYHPLRIALLHYAAHLHDGRRCATGWKDCTLLCTGSRGRFSLHSEVFCFPR